MKTWFSSDFIRFRQISSELFFLVTTCPWKKKHIENQIKSKKHAPKTKLHCSHFDIKAPSVQPFCFCSNGEANEGYEKGNEINLCKGEKQTSGKGNQTLDKGKNTSAKGKPASAKGKPLKKGAVQKGILKKQNLQKLGQLSLQDKIKQIAETNDDEHEAAKKLQKSMATAEKSRTWSKHQTHPNKNGNEEERDAFNNASKNEKGELTALFLMRKEAAKFCNVSRSIGTKQEVTMTEKWLSEKEALEKCGADLENIAPVAGCSVRQLGGL